jgi:hypothetical protein
MTGDLRMLNDQSFYRDINKRVGEISRIYGRIDTRLPRGIMGGGNVIKLPKFEMGFKMPRMNNIMGFPTTSRRRKGRRSRNPWDIDFSRMMRF